MLIQALLLLKGSCFMKRIFTHKAFTFIEIMIVTVILALLASGIVFMNILRARQTADASLCLRNRSQIDQAEARYFTDKGNHSENLQNLVDAGYLASLPKCPAAGVYAWVPADEGTVDYQARIGCSVHSGGDTANALTSLGSTFKEITSGMIDLIKQFYEKNGRYPRTWGDYVFTDIGLDPAEWQKAYDGIIYTPGGNRIKIEPAEGYEMTVTGIDGEQKVLTSDLNWNIWYDMKTEAWYYKKIESGSEVNIDTLVVK